MTRSSWSVLMTLALCAPAAAQPAPTTPPAPAPAPGTPPPAGTTPTTNTPTTSVPGTPAAGTQQPGEVTPPSDGTVPPTDGAAPVPAEPPPPPPPPPLPAVLRTQGLLASTGADQHIATHSYALDHETTLPDHQFSASVFADYWFSSGPRIGGTVGMFRSFELVLGVLRDTYTTGGGMTGQPEMSTGTTRIMYGGNIAFLSIMGVQLSAGMMLFSGDGDTGGNGSFVPTGQLSIPLDAHWLPFHIENTRVRATYPFGLGIEWGAL